MRVQVNGETREIEEAASVMALLESLRLPLQRVAVERNREILPRARYAETLLHEGDCLEIVRFVGGG